jgi:NADPH:quinone reductase-like Zn-dependent oxidoreductase
MPVAAQTAWQGIFTHGHLEKGRTILIHGAAGAVGAYAVQLASHAGATVIATASGHDGTIRPDVATVYALQDATQAWTDIAGTRSHGKIVLRVA